MPDSSITPDATMRDVVSFLRDRTGLPLDTGQVLLLRNIGGRGDATARDDHLVNRGFNLLLCDADGRPRHYVKCRPAASPRALREAFVYEKLHQARESREFVLDACSASVSGFRILILPHSTAPVASKAIGDRTGADRHRLLADILDAAETLSRTVDGADPGVAALDIGALLPLAQSKLFDRSVTTAIDEAWRIVDPTSGLPAHGDLYARNVLVDTNGLKIIDFEAFGELRIPMYDSWCLVRSIATSDDWWAGSDARFIVDRAAHNGLSADEIRATIVMFLFVSAAVLWYRAVPGNFASQAASELTRFLAQQ